LSVLRRALTRPLLLLWLPVILAGCDPKNPADVPALETILVSLDAATVQVGQTATATATGTDQNGDPIALGSVTWSTSSLSLATISPAGVATGVAAGAVQIIATADGKTGQASLTVSAPAAIKVNEVESSGGNPGDWIELFNPTNAAVSLAGWVVKDNDDTHSYTFPAGTTIAAGAFLIVEEASLGYGLGTPDAVRLFSPFGVLVDSHNWTPHAVTSYGRCPNATGGFTTTTVVTKGAANDCSVAVRINEVESNGGTPGDWIELLNIGPNPADLSGYLVKDNDDSRTFALPAGTVIPAGGYYVVEEAAFGFGLGGADDARLFTPTGTLVDSYTWTAHATTTYGRCPDGTGAFATTTASTKGAANACPGQAPVALPWPGTAAVATVSVAGAFVSNMSGLTYEGAVGGAPAVLWAAQNGPGTLHRLLWNGTAWTPDAANGWGAGKALRYPNGTGNPDSEGVTFAAGGPAGGMYVATERNNDASTVSRSSILRFDPGAAGATLTATNDWNLTADLPVVGANLGIEAITWVPDSYLVARGFRDEATAALYNPATYPDHGTGLFFVGVEGNGIIYAYALNHVTNGFTRVATIATGFTGVMGLEFDRELEYLWATCDDGCGNQSAVLEINTQAGSPTLGRFAVIRLFERAATMPNINNEGIAIAPQAECAGGQKPVFWVDDNETGGFSIRRASVPCVRFP